MKRIVCFLMSALFATCALAQAPYPSRPIRLVLPLAVGSATDLIGRVLAKAVSESIGQPIVVDNKAGALGTISATEVARAAPDGYTLLIGTSSALSTAPFMQKNLSYDPVADFTPITDVGRYTLFFYVNADVPAKTLQEFIAYAKTKPGRVTCANGSVTTQLSCLQLAQFAGIDLLQVPYKSGPQSMLDMVAGRIDAQFETPTTGLVHVKSGKLRALATTLRSPSVLLPDVPPIYDAGVPQFEIVSWMGLFGPAKMPREIVERLNREFGAAMKRPDVIAEMDRQGFALTPSTPEQLGVLTRQQIDVYGRLLKEAGVKPE
ncbi:MAG: tripartite tricarboxylate transporter substrate binding protein [Betaproteobacteria bacterium]|nr:tripartite tricarboxylate transporter substrate binding protein [Betaproteobacteria bacterium]